MEQKKSVVKSAIFKKAHSGTNGLFYIFELTFDNGDKGNYFSSKEQQDAFKEGQEAEYTVETKTNGVYTNTVIKPVRQAGARPMGNPVYEHKRTALKCATDLVCAGKIEEKNILTAAKKFIEFLNT